MKRTIMSKDCTTGWMRGWPQNESNQKTCPVRSIVREIAGCKVAQPNEITNTADSEERSKTDDESSIEVVR